MWNPYYNIPFLTTLPLHLENGAEMSRHAAGALQWPPSVHVNQTVAAWRGFPAFPKATQSSNEAKVFLIHRSLYDLIKGPIMLEMTDQKLLDWYLCLPVEDRHLIKENGGLRVFLQKHPALGVTGEVVYVKEEIRGVHRAEETPALTESSHCRSSQCCWCYSPSTSSAARMCGQCCKARASPQEAFLSVEKKVILLPNAFEKELNLRSSDESAMNQQCNYSSTKWMDIDHRGTVRSGNDPKKEYHSVIKEQSFAHGTSEVFQWIPEQEGHAERMEDLLHQQDPDFSAVGEAGFGQKCTEGASQSAYEDCFPWTAQDKARSSRPVTSQRFLAVDGKVAMNQSEEINGDLGGNVMSSSDRQSTRVKKMCSLERQIVQCDAVTSTELSTMDQDAQTLSVSTAEKSTITDVYMADLDYFKQEFIRLKLVEAEVGSLKEKLKSFEGKERSSHQRAVQAELSLLALQHAMCQQYCWGRYCTSLEGSRFLLGKNIMPESMIEVLQILEDNYQEMRKNILSGVALDQLRPLSVDCQKIASEGCYIPAEEIKSAPQNESCSFCEESMLTESSGGGGQGLECRIITSLKEGLNEKTEAFTHQDSSLFGKNGALPIRTIGAPEPESLCKESSTNKSRQEGQKSHSTAAEKDSEIQGEGFFHEQELDQYFLGVKDLPNDSAENNVDQFGKYQSSGVKTAIFFKNVRTATVSVLAPSAPERAVEDLNGHVVKGQSIEGKQIPDGTGLGPQKQACSVKSCRSVGDTPAVVVKGLSPPLEKLVNVLESPTSCGVFVPRRTVADGFGALMAQLSLRHPGLAQRSIMDALLELLAGRSGFLSDLPQETIVEMTSTLLKRAPSEEVSLRVNEDPKWNEPAQML
ncbi:RNA-binding protein 44-like isoform X3 [Brienomyrus brachyistius]|uniref:RNA-binding protein 44-like isoform X3 n=1 Tax=Brienomyrus brachyistius TaxID=42636 RepID=UPI0020B218EF|nr:RNA-binding protein 44-like isoform X3 [Brienomyrus brachyistius]